MRLRTKEVLVFGKEAVEKKLDFCYTMELCEKYQKEALNTMKKAFQYALIRSLPIMLGYIFLGIAFGLVLQKAGLGPEWAFLISLVIYAGSMQFALVGILTGGLGFLTTAVMTLLINSRHAFYGLTFIERFKAFKRAYPYMVFSLTDETYSLLCSMPRPKDFTDHQWDMAFFFVSLLDHIYWILGSVIGAAAGEMIAFDSTGIDFAMTALFVVIAVDQWKHARTHMPAVTGFACGFLFLALIRTANFILPALAAAVGVLLLSRKAIEKKMEEREK